MKKTESLLTASAQSDLWRNGFSHKPTIIHSRFQTYSWGCVWWCFATCIYEPQYESSALLFSINTRPVTVWSCSWVAIGASLLPSSGGLGSLWWPHTQASFNLPGGLHCVRSMRSSEPISAVLLVCWNHDSAAQMGIKSTQNRLVTDIQTARGYCLEQHFETFHKKLDKRWYNPLGIILLYLIYFCEIQDGVCCVCVIALFYSLTLSTVCVWTMSLQHTLAEIDKGVL